METIIGYVVVTAFYLTTTILIVGTIGYIFGKLFTWIEERVI